MLLNCGVGEDSWVPWTARRSNQLILKKINLNIHWKDHAEAETPILWLPDVKSWLIWKDLMLGKIEGSRRRGRQDEMVVWQHWLDGYEFDQAPQAGDVQGGLVCCSLWGHKESDTNELLNWTEHCFSWTSFIIVNEVKQISLADFVCTGPITSWEIDGELLDFILGGSKITADSDCSHEIKRCLLLGRKAMTNIDRILKSRDITLPTKVCLVKATVFPVIMCGWESWTIKKAEHWRIDAFELCCWRRFLKVPWTAWRSNQPILKEISPAYSLEGLMLKLKLQYFGCLMWRADSFEKTWCWERLKAGEGDNRGWDGWMVSPTQWTWVWVNFRNW